MRAIAIALALAALAMPAAAAQPQELSAQSICSADGKLIGLHVLVPHAGLRRPPR